MEEASQFAEQSKIFFMEVSALTNKDDNVFKAFVTLVEGMCLPDLLRDSKQERKRT